MNHPPVRRLVIKHLDVILAVLGAAVWSVLCVQIDAFEQLAVFVDRYDAWQIDEAIIVLLFAGAASLFLYARRTNDLRVEVSRRRAAELINAEMTRRALADGVAERRSLEEAVRANEQRLESILATAHQAIVTIDQTGAVTGWNQHAELTFGWSAGEVLGRGMSEIIIPLEMRAAHKAGLARFMADRVARLIGSRIEVTALRRNGDVFPIELALSATHIGENWQFTALIQDISERRAQTELFENAFDHAPIGMALVALDGQLMKLNSAFCDIVGYERDEAVTLDFQTITHPEDLADDLNLLVRLIAREIPSYQLEKRYIRKSGRVVWVRLSVSLVLGSDGAPKHLIAQVQDLSAERESEGRYRLLAESASDMVGLYSVDGHCMYMSPSSAKILGFPPEELIGKTVFGFMPAEEREAMARATARLQAAPAGVTVTHLTRLRRKDGQIIRIEIGMRMAASDDGAPRIVSACRDVTSRIEAQEALEERTRELTRAHAAAEQSAALAREAEILFKGIFDSSSDLNFVYDVGRHNFPMNTRNEAAERALKITAVEARGRDLRELFAADAATRMLQCLQETVASGASRHTIEHRMLAEYDGTFDVQLVPLCNEKGKVLRVFVSKRDISELKRAEQAALQANILMQTAEKIGHMGYSALNLVTQEINWSDEIWTIFGLDRDHDTPSFDKLINRRHPEDRARVAQELANAIASGATEYESSYRLLLPDGEIRHILARGTIRREDGVAVSAFGVLLDISELKQAEAKARRSDLRYRLIAENSTDIIVTSTMAGIATFVSPSCEVATGYTSEDMVGEYALKNAHPDDLAHVVAAFRSLAAGNRVFRVRWRSSHKTEDRWVWLESSPALLLDPATGAPASFLDVVRDVTVQKEQEDALAAARTEAEEAMQSKAHFLANMSHEIRTPLNSIIGFSRLLNESATLGQEDERRVRMVHSASLALHAVIDNVLDFSKLEADKLALHCTPFDAPDFFASTVALLEPQAATRSVCLRVEVDPRLPDRLIGDSGRLRQILLNLLSNAVKFTQDGSVSTSVMLVNEEGGAARLRVEVADTGLGIPEDKLPTLFNRFVQASASVAPQYGGTGLGLAISRQLVSLMGGEIGVSSELGKGSTFWFEISLPLAPVQKGDSEVVAASILSLSGKRILVVDDVDLNRELMIAMLSRYDCEVVLAEDGVGALEALELQRFDLVLMDCQMPVMDGFAATREIRKQTGPAAAMPIIAVTASAEPEHLARCRQAGMDEYLTKPLDPSALESMLRRYLGDGRTVPVSDAEEPVVHEGEAVVVPVVLASTEAAPRAAGGSLRARYDARRTAMLEALDAMIRSGRFTEREVSEVNVMAHNLAGTAGMFGEADLGDVAAALDTGLAQWHPDERPKRIREAFDTMCAAISA